MDHVVAVGVIQRARHAFGDLDGVLDGELFLAIELVAQRFAFDERHHVEDQPVGLAGIVQREDVGML